MLPIFVSPDRFEQGQIRKSRAFFGVQGGGKLASWARLLSPSNPTQSAPKPVEAPDQFGRDEFCGILRVECCASNGNFSDRATQRNADTVATVLRIAHFRLEEQAVDR